MAVSWLTNGGDPNHLLTGMILQVPNFHVFFGRCPRRCPGHTLSTPHGDPLERGKAPLKRGATVSKKVLGSPETHRNAFPETNPASKFALENRLRAPKGKDRISTTSIFRCENVVSFRQWVATERRPKEESLHWAQLRTTSSGRVETRSITWVWETSHPGCCLVAFVKVEVFWGFPLA